MVRDEDVALGVLRIFSDPFSQNRVGFLVPPRRLKKGRVGGIAARKFGIESNALLPDMERAVYVVAAVVEIRPRYATQLVEGIFFSEKGWKQIRYP